MCRKYLRDNHDQGDWIPLPGLILFKASIISRKDISDEMFLQGGFKQPLYLRYMTPTLRVRSML
jgi:hypothetical protein